MEVRFGAETLDPAKDGGTGDPALPQEPDDRLVERLTVPLVALADVDPDEEALAFDDVLVVFADTCSIEAASSLIDDTRPSPETVADSA